MTTSNNGDATPGSAEINGVPPYYRVVGGIASDRFGDTYLCVHADSAEIARAVAVKLVRRQLTSNPAFTRTLLDELERLGKLSHPNIVEVVEFGDDQGQVFIVTSYLEGGTLADLGALHAGPLPAWLAVQVITDVLSAVQAAHAAVGAGGAAMPICHGDITPGNIWLGTYGNIRLAEFGFARAAGQANVELTGAVDGGVYLAPEQLLGGVVDHRADLFSVGAVLWSALVGRPLFTHTNQLIDPEITPPGQVRSELGRWFDPVCTRALRRDPADRYQSAAEMARALHNAAAMAGAAGSSQKLGELVADRFAKRIAEQREVIGKAARSSRPHARVERHAMTPVGPMRARSKPPIPVGVYLQNQLLSSNKPPAWPYSEPVTEELPRKLAALQPDVRSRRRLYQSIGLALLLFVACALVAASLFRVTGDASRQAPPPPVEAPAAPDTTAPAR